MERESIDNHETVHNHSLNLEELPRFSVKYVQLEEIETVCGVNDFQDVERYDGKLGVTKEFVIAHQAPVGQIQWNNNLADKYNYPGNVSGIRWGSGTLISEDLFLTAGHCFDSTPDEFTVPRIEGTNNPISPEEIAKNMKVNFNYQYDHASNLRSEQSFAILDLVEYRVGGLDYAIVRLDGKPGEKFGYTKISKTDANINDMLCIIQHPDGKPKSIEAGPVTYLKDGDERIGYGSLDTLGGSSGAGILLASNGTLVGVHTNGGCRSNLDGHNYGVRISSLLLVSPTLEKLTLP
ncbi:hypothetical protein COM89_23240 [Bacillus thuringiensis]|uniref:trypsin-like serine peptidase n=1 Tax=Bacillus thuringiensis TaxID=1428 RepID=UPI000BEC6EB8|nr:trypsin-like peptidase domain-containing protein [Bacillus thuringiensis]PEB73236.1 hypothetical protein COM89_23240 [Bacillus thuringiensis]